METVTQVRARENYMLELEFNTGETRVFDARPYLERGVFTRLKDPAIFKQAYVAYDTVCWPGNLDIAPEPMKTHSRIEITHRDLNQPEPGARRLAIR